MGNIFQTVQLKSPKRSKFNLSHGRMLSCDMGQLVPILVQEILPGDSFRVRTEHAVRFAPMLAPAMARVNVKIENFFVPNRLVWTDGEWEKFITGGRLGTDAPAPPTLQMSVTADNLGLYDVGRLWDHMGLPTNPIGSGVSNPQLISAIPFRAYQLIYNEYYRDQNLSDPVLFATTGGTVTDQDELARLLTLRTRSWEKDYFTSALPFAQRGPAVLMPIEGVGDVTYLNTSKVLTSDGVDAAVNTLVGTGSSVAGDMAVERTGTSGFATSGRIENIDEVTFDNTSITINDLRRSVKLQEWLEKNAVGGARYTEQLRAHFDVVSDDARLQRPEYLGGGTTPVVISEVLSTFQAPDGEGNPQANMAGHGVSVGGKNGFTRSFKEHGYVITLMSILPRTSYQQGIPRHMLRFDKFDYAFPEFAHIGEQEIKNGELYYDFNGSGQDDTWGYQARYAEYKYTPSTTHGTLKTSLSFWTMTRIFTGLPPLNAAFVQADPTKRIFAVDAEDPDVEHLYVQVYHKIDAIRPLPYYGTPEL